MLDFHPISILRMVISMSRGVFKVSTLHMSEVPLLAFPPDSSVGLWGKRRRGPASDTVRGGAADGDHQRAAHEGGPGHGGGGHQEHQGPARHRVFC